MCGVSSKEYDVIDTQENDIIATDNEDGSMPSEKLNQIEGSFDECSHLRMKDTNLSA